MLKTVAIAAMASLFAGSLVGQEPAKKDAPASESRPSVERRMGRAKPLSITQDREIYGADITLKEDTKLADVMKDPKSFEGRKIRVAGVIEGVCQKKGCWMNVKDGDDRVQVKFVDYSFFVPLDVAGRNVVVEGIAKETVVSEAMRRHYAEDAGKSKEEIAKIKGDVKSVMLVVEAVEIGGPAIAAPKAAESKPAEKKE